VKQIVEFIHQQGKSSGIIYCFSRMNEDENYYENKAIALKMADAILSFGGDIN